MEDKGYAKGLEGVIAGESEICKVEGDVGRLHYRGYSVEELAEYSDFEEVTYLLLFGKLPTRQELSGFSESMRSARALRPPVLEMIRNFPREAHPMELLQSVISYLSGYVTHKIRHSSSCNCRLTLHQVSQLATVVAAWYRFQKGMEPVAPRSDLSHGANFLYMLNGEELGKREGRIMDQCLVLHAEHGFNVSTFTARVVASSFSTCYCSISAAIGSLYGPLHGGANEKVMEMVEQIGRKEGAEKWVDEALARKQKVMGMGHRVYKAKDPRAKLIEQYLQELSAGRDDSQYYKTLKEIERVFRLRMEEKGKPIYPNVDFFSGAVYRLLGIPSILFTPIFAIARVSGWLAHVLEQRTDNRLFRPKSLYVGPAPRPYLPIDQR